MVGILLLFLLRAVSSEEWTFTTPPEVTAQKGVCVRIPCSVSGSPTSNIDLQNWVWINSENWAPESLVFHSKESSRVPRNFKGRTQLSGKLQDGDCSLVIDHIRRADEGPYFFGVESNVAGSHVHSSVIRLRVSNFTDKPRIVLDKIVEGKPVNVKCVFETMCWSTPPSLTWETGANHSSDASNIISQRGDIVVYTSTLRFTPTAEDEGRDLSCIVTFPTVSSRQTITLTMAGGKLGTWRIILIAVGIILMIALVGFLIYKIFQWRRSSDKQDGGAAYQPQSTTNQASGSSNAPRRADGDRTGKVDQTQSETLLYAQLQEMPAIETAIRPSESTEYASIQFK